MNSNNIKQPFVSGDKEVNALLMQLLKLRIVSKILGAEKDLGSEVIEELPGGPYRYILEEMPKINFNRYEVEKLIAGEIYAVMKAFMERLYTKWRTLQL